jgi:pimeloyl-ACP methyl ester carboxylesterase
MRSRHHESVRLTHPAGGWLQGDVRHSGHLGQAVLLLVHGFGSRRDGEKAQALETACARRGWPFAAFDFRGHGDSSGTMLELLGSNLQADLETVQTYFAERGVQHLCLVGSSMGGWASAWFALRHSDAVPACVLIAPAFHFLDSRWTKLTEAEQREWQCTGRHRVRNDWVDVEIGYGMREEVDQFLLEQLAAGWTRPALIFHGMRDDVVPYAHSLEFVEQTPFPEIELRLFKDGDHRLSAYKEKIAEHACCFFDRWFAPAISR